MEGTREIHITLPDEMAEMVKTKVSSGEYANESEVIREGLRILQERDRDLEDGLREDVAPAYESGVEAGDHASTGAAVRATQGEELATLKTDIDSGLADIAAGRVNDFDPARIIERGRKLLADRSSSA